MIRTVEQYLESLRDGRVLYCLGERVEDVTAHPTLRAILQPCAMDYYFPNAPEFRDLFVKKNEEGEDVHFLFIQPKSADDLLRRREIFVTACITGGGANLHSMGVDALAASALVASRMDRELSTNYGERVEAYRKYVQKSDIGITGAISDVKGDRSLHASEQKQHKDFYVRVVDRQKDGIVVRGAKEHISSTPGANEAIVVPCHAHGEEDKDYAVVFATPLNAKGITLIAAEPKIREIGAEGWWDYPTSSAFDSCECIIVFDDVFVPWERVFMCGEWKFSRDVVYAFATFHRLLGVSRLQAELDMLAGAAALMAEYNGLERVSHVQDKLAWLAMYAESVQVIGKAACTYCEKERDSELVTPNTLYANIAKYIFADNFHEGCKIAQDICGGLAATIPTYRDWQNPETRPLMEKYLAGKDGIPTEHRLKIVRLVKDMTDGWYQVANIHGEGSLAAQRIFIHRSADWEKYKAAAKRLTNIPGWEKDPLYGSLPDYPTCVQSEFPPIDTKYKL